MKRIKKVFMSLLSMVLVLTLVKLPVTVEAVVSTNNNDLKLWYDSPAADSYNGWEKYSLPVGNSGIGASVFGRYDTERIQLNEKSLWSGGPAEGRDYNGGNLESSGQYGGAIEEIQNLFASGNSTTASNKCNNLVGVSDDAGTNGYGYYLSYGNMYLHFNHSNVSNYYRELDLRTAISTVQYTSNGVQYKRETFVSYPDNVLVTRITADSNAIDVEVEIQPDNAKGGSTNNPGSTSYTRQWNTTVKEHLISVQGTLDDNQMKFVSHTKVISNGTTTDNSSTVSVAGASEVTIITSIGTDYKNDYPVYRTGETDQEVSDRILKYVTKAEVKGYESLREDHIADYNNIFGRVDLELGQVPSSKTTDALLAAYKNSSASEEERRYLEVLLFQYGRYLTIASSRETPEDDPTRETLPSNLQGIWVGANNSAWHSDYHLNVNLQMNYWPTYSTNMAECAEPLINYVDSLREPGRVTANIYAGIESTEENPENGYMAHTQNNPFGWTCPGWEFNWGWSPAAVPWILQNVWEYYEFTLDEEYMGSKIYPMMREEAVLYDQMLVQNKDGKYVSVPAYSPEHGPRTEGNTYEQALIWQLYEDTIKAAEILNKDAAKVEEWKEKQANLKGPIEIGTDGQIKEWYHETSLTSVQANQYGHRHISHMLGLFPGDLITAETPEWFAAAKVSMENRTDESTGWGMGQRINTWARLGEGNKAYKLITDLFKGGILTNLWDTHEPYQIDGNFGYTSGVAEMLMQSNAGYINMLPALPDTWSAGSVDGLVARGNFEVSMDWTNGQITSATILSNKGETAIVEVENGSLATVLDEDGNAVEVGILSFDRISFATEEGKTYTLTNFPQSTAIPSDVEAVRTSKNAVELSWGSVEGATYNVYRRVGVGELVLMESNLSNTSYIDDKAYEQLEDVKYYLTATKNYIESAKSAAVTAEAASVGNDGEYTIAPDGTKVKFIWQYNGDGESVMANLQSEDNAGDSSTVFDNNDSTGVILRWRLGYAYDGDNIANGDYVGAEFKQPVNLKNITFKFLTSQSGDVIYNPRLEYKTEYGDWQTLNNYSTGTEISYTAENALENVKAIRIVHTEGAKKKWVRLTGINFTVEESVSPIITLDGSHMSVTAGNSQAQNGDEGPASFVLDENPTTRWHTNWYPSNANTDDHYLDFTLDDLYIIENVMLQQRQDASPNGVVSRFRLLVKENEDDEWVEAISNGTMSTSKDMQTIECQPVKAKYIRVKIDEAGSNQNGKAFASLAEVRFTGQLYSEPVITDEMKAEAKAINVESDKLTLYWPKISGALAYVVKNVDTNEEFVTSSNVLDIEGLDPLTTYNFEITIRDYEEVGTITINDVTTLKAEVGKVSNVQLGELNGYSLSDVSWNNSTDSDVAYYVVYVNGVGYRTETNPYEFVDVSGLGVQTIRVVAVDSNGRKSIPDGCSIKISTHVNDDGTYDRTFWTGAAFDKDSDEENWSNSWKDGPVANMLDGASDTFWHTNYNRSPNKAYLPVYVFFDFGEELEFDAFNWKQRSNDANRGNSAKDYEFYINVTDEDLIPETSSAGAPGYETLEEGWLLVKYSYSDGVLTRHTDNIIDLDNTYSAKQVMMKITSTYDVANIGQLANITADEFYVYKNHTDEPALKETTYTNGVVEKDGYVRESFYTEIVDGELVEGDTVLNSDRETYNDAYAKYVTSKVLSVKAQSEIKGDKVNVRFLSSIPSVNLERLRFKVEILNSAGAATKTGYVYTNRVFETVVSNETNDVVANNPSDVFDNSLSSHFFIGKLNNIPTKDPNLEIRVTPYWLPYGTTDKDESYVKGIERTFKVQEFIDNAPNVISEVE